MKVLYVSRCRDCPYYIPNTTVTGCLGGICSAQRLILTVEDPDNIIEFCPLPDAEDV